MTPTVPAVPPVPEADLVRFYEEQAEMYLRSLPLEHFMEATDHARQREITLASFALIGQARPDIQCFNELLVQYPRPDRRKPGQVVPDNFVVVNPAPVGRLTNYSLALQPVGPFLVLEYVSKHNRRKDYDDNLERYEKELRVPYYLLHYADNEELTVFRLADGKYTSVKPNAAGRLAIPELELEAALLGGWVRFWFRGELVPLPTELKLERDAERQARVAAERRAAAAEAELARLRELLAKAPPPP